MEKFLEVESLFIVLLLVVSVVAVVVRRIRLPYTVALVLVGLFLTVERPLLLEGTFDVTPGLIMAIFVPPLVFQAAFHLELKDFQANLLPILTLAVPGVLLTTVIVGGIVSVGVGLPIGVAVVFGALIAATDPVAVVAIFRSLGVPRRLGVIVEGESLVNDGTAIVVYQIALTVVAVGSFNLVEGVFDFLLIAIGGVGIGAAMGWVVSRMIAQIDDYFIEITLTTVLAFGSYLLAEQFHLSGVLAVVAAGIVSGNLSPQGMSPTTKMVLYNFWEYLAFLANSLVFLLIGLKIDIFQLIAHMHPIMIAVVAVLVSRAIAVYGLVSITNRVASFRHMPSSWRHVVFWGGLRGAIALALALSLPSTLPHRDLLELMAFGVVLFTLVAQGTTIQFLLKGLGLSQRLPQVEARERQLGRLFAVQAGLKHISNMHRDGLLARDVWVALREEYERTNEQLSDEIAHLFTEHADLEREVLLLTRRESLHAERSALGDALRQGLISEGVYRELTTEIDRRVEALDIISEASTVLASSQE